MVSLLQCRSRIKALERNAHQDFTLRPSRLMENISWRGEVPCIADIKNEQVDRRLVYKTRIEKVAPWGSLSFSNGAFSGDVPTFNDEGMIQRIQGCGGEITDIHRWKPEGAPEVKHVHFRTRTPQEARCLTDMLLREP